MKKTLPILIAFIFFATNTIFAQYTETINSNRPGDSQSAFSVGSNVIQIETGAYLLNETSKFKERVQNSNYCCILIFIYNFYLS